jgi:DNA-directed RNA polymerase beta subunit
MPPKTSGTKRKVDAAASSSSTAQAAASSTTLPRVKREKDDDDDGDDNGAKAIDVDVDELKQLHWGDDLFNSEKLNDPIKNASDKWALVPTFLKLHGLVRQHIDSFDHFVNEEMKQIMLANHRIECGSFYLEYKDIWIGEPRIDEGMVVRNVTPQQCRLRDMTYAAPIYVTVEYVRGRSIVVRKGLCIGRMPIMLRSSKCVLLGLNKDQLASAGECEHDPGGYFIVRGTEKVILIQEQLSKNRVIIEHDSKGTLAASCTSTGNMFKSRFQIVREKDGVLRARHINLDNVNAVVLLRALGVHSEAAIAAVVGTDLIEALGPTFAEAAMLGVTTEIEALDHIGANLAGQALWRQKRSRIDEARNALLRVVLSHVPVPHFDLRGKAAFVALMMRRVLLAASNTALVDDRDYYGNKRLELAGELLNLLFEDLFKIFNATLKKNIEKSLEKVNHVHQFDALKQLRPDLITNGLARAISTGNWSVKRFKMERAGVTAVLSRLSFIAALGMMTRITSQFEKTRKISGPRALQPSQFGVLCPSDTPEGESCGLVKNLALLTHVTTGDDEGAAAPRRLQSRRRPAAARRHHDDGQRRRLSGAAQRQRARRHAPAASAGALGAPHASREPGRRVRVDPRQRPRAHRAPGVGRRPPLPAAARVRHERPPAAARRPPGRDAARRAQLWRPARERHRRVHRRQRGERLPHCGERGDAGA